MHWQALLNCFLCICTLPVLETFYAWSCDKIMKKTRFKIQCVWNIPKSYFKFPKLCILQSELLNKYVLLNIHWILSQYVILNFKWQQHDCGFTLKLVHDMIITYRQYWILSQQSMFSWWDAIISQITYRWNNDIFNDWRLQ